MKLIKSFSTLLMLTVAIMSQQFAVANSMVLMSSQSTNQHAGKSDLHITDHQSLIQHCSTNDGSLPTQLGIIPVLGDAAASDAQDDCCGEMTDCSMVFCASIAMVTSADSMATLETHHFSNFPAFSNQVITRPDSLFRPPIQVH